MQELIRLAEVCMFLPVSNGWPEQGPSAEKKGLKTRLRSSLKGDMLESLMHISINRPEVQECKSLVKKAVKKWQEVKARRKIAKSIPASATSSNCPTVSTAAVQVDMLPPPGLDVPEQVNAMGDGIGIKDLEKEVNSVISTLKLPDISNIDDSHCDYDTDFESDSD